MTSPDDTERLSPERTAALVDFARTCKAAARSVSLYPAEHPAIQGALRRVVDAVQRVTTEQNLAMSVLPESLTLDRRAPAKPDPAIGELAALLHERLVGELHIDREATASEWRIFLLLLSRTPDELLADGGIARAWSATGEAHFSIREIDYAEVLREREGADGAAWDRVIEFCLQGRIDVPLDEQSLEAVIEALQDPERVAELVDRIQTGSSPGAGGVAARLAALLEILRQAIELLKQRQQHHDVLLQAVADSGARMTPELMLALLQQARRQTETGEPPLAAAIVERISDRTVAAFVSGSVVAQHGATERLALAFEALAPGDAHRDELLGLARTEASQTPLGGESGFDELWQGASEMLKSYSDKSFVSEEYGRELSGTRTRAIDVEGLSDDPPDRVEAWLATVNEGMVRDLDFALLRDLLRIEGDPVDWQAVAAVAGGEIERRTLLGDVATAQALLDALVADRGEDGRAALREAAESAVQTFAGGEIVQHIVSRLRKIPDADVEPLSCMCHTIGTAVVRPLAIALAGEENNRAIRRLRELLLGFGAAGRQSVEPLKNSPNPAVRRTAIDLLRVFGGREALPELTSMLDDADPQVQRESIRAIVHIGTDEAYAVLKQALVGRNASRDTILQQLIGLRDDKAIPLLCYVLDRTSPRGTLVPVHAQIIETLGSLTAHPDSTETLRAILYRGTWWAPFRTAALRRAAAASLRRLRSPEADAVLAQAAASGSRGVRNAARPYAASTKEDAR